MNTIDNSYASILNMYNQTISQTSSAQSQNTSSISPTTTATTTQPTDSVSISQEAQQAYQALNQSLVNSLSPDDSTTNTLESILVSSMQASMQIIADKANAATTGSVSSVSGAASPTGAINTDWGSALDSMVSSGTITQGQETSIENALNAEAQSKVSAGSAASTPTASTSNLNNLLSN